MLGFTSISVNVIELLSFVSSFAILCGFLFNLKYERQPLTLAITVLFFISFAAGYLGFNRMLVESFGFKSLIISLTVNCICFAYLLPWALKMKDTNILVAIMLLGAFVWFVFSIPLLGLLFGTIADGIPTAANVIYQIINLGVTAIPALAAFVEMRE